MADLSVAQREIKVQVRPALRARGLLRLFRYIAVKGLTVFLTLVVGLYITILIVNLNGYIDEIYRGLIAESVGARLQAGWLADVPPAERNEIAQATIASMEEAQGLNEPFLLRTGYWLVDSLFLTFGGGIYRAIVLQALPYTFFLVGLTNFVIFTVSIGLALILSRHPGSRSNRLFAILSPLTFAPSWVHGVILITIISGWLRWLPHPDTLAKFMEGWNPATLQNAILPSLAIILNAFFQGVFAWRTFFQIYSREDYVELARAKGLPDAMIERRYLLKPVLPYVVTSFAFLAIALWQEAIAIEHLFNWPGIGRLFLMSVWTFRTPLILATVVIFAYMLAVTVFILDILYALLDPRIRVGSGDENLRRRLFRPGQRWRFTNLFRRTRQPVRRFQEEQLGLPDRPRPSPVAFLRNMWKSLADQRSGLKVLFRYPSAIVGLAGILFLVLVALYTLIEVPYERAVQLWRGQGGDWYQNNWYLNPVDAPPAWTNWFRDEKLPATFVLDSRSSRVEKQTLALTQEMTQISFRMPVEYSADRFPSETILYFRTNYEEKHPLITLTWHTPDGRQLDLGDFSIRPFQAYYISTDASLQRKLGMEKIEPALFGDPSRAYQYPLKGEYALEVNAFVFEPGADVDLEAVFYGQVHGLFGTDSQRRDPMLGLLWGTTLALAFGVFGAVGTSLLAMTIAALGAWHSGWVDGLIQRLTEINLILPKLSIAVLISILYTKSIWAILGVIVLLSIFGSAVKNYRAVFLQVKASGYIEAARAYGARDGRIIWRYLVPRILPVLIPQVIILIPGYVFYEATLAFLGVTDPYLPTWGKIIFYALYSDALLKGSYHMLLIPIALLSLTGLVFALFGYALERIFNPNLREV